jgi:hypothetical protein
MSISWVLNQLSLDAEVVSNVLRKQAAAFKNPPWTLEDLLDALRKTVPRFVDQVGRLVVAPDAA